MGKLTDEELQIWYSNVHERCSGDFSPQTLFATLHRAIRELHDRRAADAPQSAENNFGRCEVHGCFGPAKNTDDIGMKVCDRHS